MQDDWAPPRVLATRRRRPPTPIVLESEEYVVLEGWYSERRVRARRNRERPTAVPNEDLTLGSINNEEVEEDNEVNDSTQQIKGPLPFASVADINKGYLWGMDVFFNARVENIRAASEAHTNHYILNAKRTREVYDRMRSSRGVEVSAMTLRPVLYCI